MLRKFKAIDFSGGSVADPDSARIVSIEQRDLALQAMAASSTARPRCCHLVLGYPKILVAALATLTYRGDRLFHPFESSAGHGR